MRRIISVCLVLAFCLSVPLVAFAAEPEEYVFEVMPPVSMLDDYDFSFDDRFGSGNIAVYEGRLPEGDYYFYVYFDGLAVKSDNPVTVRYDKNEGPSFFSEVVVSFTSEGETLSVSCTLIDYYDEEGFTPLLIVIPGFDDVSELGVDYLKLVPIDTSVSLADYVSSESLGPLLDEIVALLPVVLTVIVAYIGIRKALQWLQGVLHNS